MIGLIGKKMKMKTNNQSKNSEEDDDENEVFAESKKKAGKKSGKSGGFQAMGLSYPVLKGILKRGYKVPTPIQRKVNQFHIIF